MGSLQQLIKNMSVEQQQGCDWNRCKEKQMKQILPRAEEQGQEKENSGFQSKQIRRHDSHCEIAEEKIEEPVPVQDPPSAPSSGRQKCCKAEEQRKRVSPESRGKKTHRPGDRQQKGTAESGEEPAVRDQITADQENRTASADQRETAQHGKCIVPECGKPFAPDPEQHGVNDMIVRDIVKERDPAEIEPKPADGKHFIEPWKPSEKRDRGKKKDHRRCRGNPSFPFQHIVPVNLFHCARRHCRGR